MAEIKTVPAHTIEVPKTFVISLNNDEATDFMSDLYLAKNTGGLNEVTQEIYDYLAGRNNF